MQGGRKVVTRAVVTEYNTDQYTTSCRPSTEQVCVADDYDVDFAPFGNA